MFSIFFGLNKNQTKFAYIYKKINMRKNNIAPLQKFSFIIKKVEHVTLIKKCQFKWCCKNWGYEWMRTKAVDRT